MDNGDLLLLAVADVTVDGQRPEGVGVRPTIKVPFDPVDYFFDGALVGARSGAGAGGTINS
jgi:C-terminal processing protease CtpA/Prc